MRKRYDYVLNDQHTILDLQSLGHLHVWKKLAPNLSQSIVLVAVYQTRGMELLLDPWYNKGSAFPVSERDRLGLRGLLPPRGLNLEKQVKHLAATAEDTDESVAKVSRFLTLS